MDHDGTGCQAPPEGPILCVNNCGFFGSVAAMNMCSKCYKDAILKQEQAKLAASSIESIVNGPPSSNVKRAIASASVDVEVDPEEPDVITSPEASQFGLVESVEVKAKQGPKRCGTCKKRVGLTGFNCRCGASSVLSIDTQISTTAPSSIALLLGMPFQRPTKLSRQRSSIRFDFDN